jgi:hypothetical protein
MTGNARKHVRITRWLAIISVLLLLVAVTLITIIRHINPIVRSRAVAMLRNRFDSDVELRDLQVTLFPQLAIHGAGLILRHHGRTDVPPLIAIEKFSAEGKWSGLLGKPWHLSKVHLRGLSIHIPPREKRDPHKRSRGRDIPILVDELFSEDAKLELIPSNPEKLPHIFLIHHLKMNSVGLGHSAAFIASLTNPTPPGEIKADGHFGPWQSEDPSATPLSAVYTFNNADLSKFHGISGILSSQGKFGGVLDEIEVEGETDTPNFAVTIAGHRVALHTEYKATVDGTNGDTLLHPVIAHFLNSTIIANGGVVKAQTGKGRDIILGVSADHARIEDLLKLAVKADKPLLTGLVSLKTKFELPPGENDISERLKLNGEFGLGNAIFTSPEIREKIRALSRRGQGKPQDKDAGSAVSQLKGRFILRDTVITFPGLSFEVEGAAVRLTGTYALKNEELDFHGQLLLDAKLSQATTGFKSILLKAVDPFFRKEGKTVLPIKITGTRDKPSFGLELGHKSRQEEARNR